MSRIQGRNTKPELLVRRYLHSAGFRYRLHAKNLPGKPDIVLPKYQTVIFINGCFWHGHKDCRYYVIPKTRTAWWLKKIEGNKNKDINNTRQLQNMGWKVVEIWECELKPKVIETTLSGLLARIKG